MEIPAFRERLPWKGGDLQTLRNLLVGATVDLSPWPESKITIPLAGGDAMSGLLQSPGSDARLLIVIVHGLTGSAQSLIVRMTARHLLDRGHAVLRLNMRGAEPVAATSSKLAHAGMTGDLDQALAMLDRPFALLGFSLGGNLALKYLGEGRGGARLRGGVSISAPIDLHAAQRHIARPRNHLYQRHLLRDMKQCALSANIPASLRHAAQAATDIFSFDEQVVAPMHGYQGAVDYYQRNSARQTLAGIDRPTLLLAADNDPWIPVESYRDMALPRRVQMIISRGGGHVGFHDAASPIPWHARAAAAFLAIL